MKLCSVSKCGREVKTKKDLCSAHYARFQRKGDVSADIPIKNVYQSLIDRFKEKVVDKDENGCMNWIGCRSNNRYGAFIAGSRIDGTRKRYTSHRLSYELFNGNIPEGMCVLHKCDNVICVNPEHLFLGTQSDNMKDMIKKGRDFHIIPIGSKHGNAKLDEEKVKDIKIKLSQGVLPIVLAEKYKVTKKTIVNIRDGKGWKHVKIIDLGEHHD